MKTLSIREASESVGRAPATIRRYIKSGRLAAEKEQGKFGEEFRIRPEDLAALGVVRSETLPVRVASAPPVPAAWTPEGISQQFVPRDLYQELSLKHERLLVQYGMIRAGGQKMLEYRAEAEMKDALLAEREKEIRELRDRSEKETTFLQNHLRQAEVEIEDRNIEIALLQDKVRRLEMTVASAEAVRSFDDEVRALRESPERAGAPAGPSDTRKLDLLQDWLKACEQERRREET